MLWQHFWSSHSGRHVSVAESINVDLAIKDDTFKQRSQQYTYSEVQTNYPHGYHGEDKKGLNVMCTKRKYSRQFYKCIRLSLNQFVTEINNMSRKQTVFIIGAANILALLSLGLLDQC